MVNAQNKNLSPLPAGKYCKLTQQSTKWCHQVHDGKSGLKAERVRALGALRSLRSKKKLEAKKRREIHFLSNEENEPCIEDYVESETAGARKRGKDAETADQQVQEDMNTAENARLRNREPKKTYQEMIVAIGVSLGDLASSDNRDDVEDEDDEKTEQGQLTEDDEPGRVTGTFSRSVRQPMERFWQKQMNLAELKQPGREDLADFFREQ